MTGSSRSGRKGRGRPREFDPGRVLEAAMQVFWRRGYGAASLPELVAATGLSTSSLYNVYGSKLALFEAALDLYLEEVIDRRMIGPMTNGEDGVADVMSYLERLEATAERRPPRGCLAINTIAELRELPPSVARRTREYRDRLRGGLIAAFVRAEERGEIPVGTAAARGGTIASIVIAFNLLVAAGTPAGETRELVDAARAVARRDGI